MRFETFQAGPAKDFMNDPAAAGRALRRWAWPIKTALVAAALVAAIPLLLAAVLAAGTGLLVFGVCRLLVLAGDALGVDPSGSKPTVSRDRPAVPVRDNVRVVGPQRQR